MRMGLLRRLAALAAADDQPLRRFLLVARLHAFLLAPRADHVTTTARTATVRVIDWVHDFATHAWTPPLPTRSSRLAPRQQLMLFIADDADGREAAAVNHTHLR